MTRILLVSSIFFLIGCKTMTPEEIEPKEMVGKSVKVTSAHKTLNFNMSGIIHPEMISHESQSNKMICRGKLLNITNEEITLGYLDEWEKDDVSSASVTNSYGYGPMGKDLICISDRTNAITIKRDQVGKIEL